MARKQLTDIDMNGKAIKNLPTTPAATTDASSKSYTDTKEPAFAAGTTAQYLRGDKTWQTLPTGGSGDVVGPASSVNGDFATFNGLTGKLIQDSGRSVPSGAVVGISDVQTLTNKTLTAATNTITGLGIANFSGVTGTPSATTYLRGDGTWVTPTSAAPSNMMTTDSTQTIAVAGTKTFNSGALIMTSTQGTGEPYSDANPPQTLQMEVYATALVTPPTGQATFNTPDGKTLQLKANDGTTAYVAMLNQAVVRVLHGATAGTARPTNATYVEWVGSVAPTNANTTNDTWVDTT